SRGPGEGPAGQPGAGRQGRAAGRAELRQQALVVFRLDGDRHATVVLGGGADERRPADVDHLDGLGRTGAALDGLLDGVEVDDDEVERLDRRPGEVARVVLAGVVGENAAEDLRVERLDPAAQDLREAGRRLDGFDLDAFVLEMLRGPPGRDDPDAPGRELAGELRDARLVVNGDERPADGRDGGGKRNRFRHPKD